MGGMRMGRKAGTPAAGNNSLLPCQRLEASLPGMHIFYGGHLGTA